MDKIKQYKKQIFTFITIWLLLEFGVYPCLTMANTFANLLGAVALLLLVLWGGISLYDYVKSSDGNPYPSPVDETITQSPNVKPKRKYTKKTK
jgi:hypothetical protein